jgi:hypothetical protein
VVAPTAKTSRKFVKGELKLTTLGYKVLGGDTDWQSVNTQTRWLGGVEIAPGGKGWRWDPEERVVVRQGDKAAPQIESTARKAKKNPRQAKTKPPKTKTKPRKASRPVAKKRNK